MPIKTRRYRKTNKSRRTRKNKTFRIKRQSKINRKKFNKIMKGGDPTFKNLNSIKDYWKKHKDLSKDGFWYLIAENDMVIILPKEKIESYKDLKKLIQTYLTTRGFDKKELSNGIRIGLKH